jgi:hypothetical protein
MCNSRRRSQRGKPLLDLRQPLLQGINPPNQLRSFRLRAALHRANAHVCHDSEHGHTNHEKQGKHAE